MTEEELISLIQFLWPSDRAMWSVDGQLPKLRLFADAARFGSQQEKTGPQLHVPSGAVFDSVIACVDDKDLVSLTPQAVVQEPVETDWIDWSDSSAYLPENLRVEIETRGHDRETGPAGEFNWSVHGDDDNDICRYRHAAPSQAESVEAKAPLHGEPN